jgi:hypothetical protein
MGTKKKTATKATTLHTQGAEAPRQRTNTIDKGKPNGKPKQLQAEPEPEVVEQEDEELDEVDEEQEQEWDDEELPPEASDEELPPAEEDVEPLAASEAEEEPAPVEAAPIEEQPRRRGRKPGTSNKTKPQAAATADGGGLLQELCSTAFAIKRLAGAHGKKPAQLLQAVGNILITEDQLESGV